MMHVDFVTSSARLSENQRLVYLLYMFGLLPAVSLPVDHYNYQAFQVCVYIHLHIKATDKQSCLIHEQFSWKT